MNALTRGVLAAAAMTAAQGLRAADTMLIEAEDFQFHGAWMKVGDAAASGRCYLHVPHDARDSRYDAVTRVTLDADGDYAFWVRSRDFAQDRPKMRRFALQVDAVPFEKEAGTHGREGFAWQLLGRRTLAAGDHLLALHDTARAYGRCDALFITRTDKDPGTLSGAQLNRLRTRKVLLVAEPEAPSSGRGRHGRRDTRASGDARPARHLRSRSRSAGQALDRAPYPPTQKRRVGGPAGRGRRRDALCAACRRRERRPAARRGLEGIAHPCPRVAQRRNG